MSRGGGLPRHTVLIVVGIHVVLLLAVGLPMAQCHKPPPIKPVEIVDLGSLRPGPGLPSPTSTTPTVSSQTKESSVPIPPSAEPVKEPTPTPPTPEPQPESQPEPKPEPTPVPETKPVPIPQPEPPKKHQVKVSSAKKKVTAASAEAKTSAAKSTEPPGPTASDIKNRLASKIPGETGGGGGGGGGDGAGNAGRPDGVADDFSWYRALIKQCIQSSWKKPPIPAGEKIYTEVEIKISQSGAVSFLRISRSSGDSAMDASVEQAVRSTPRLPKPLPSGLGSPDYTVILQFKLE